MTLQSLPDAAVRYRRSQTREISAAVAAAARLWGQMTPDLDRAWGSLAARLLAVMLIAQDRVVSGTGAYMVDVLAETGQPDLPDAEVIPAAVTGWAGDGRRIDTLLRGALVTTKIAIGSGAQVDQALTAGGSWLSTATGTLLSDTGRAAENLHIGVRDLGYVRMLVPPSCSRCAILAGRHYRKTQFQRHPKCDCRHIPSTEGIAGDLTVDPKAYFASLGPAERDRIFTKAGAEAIRSGADVSKVVNARRGLSPAQPGKRARLQSSNLFGREVYLTREGRKSFRLMPESIQQIAGDRAEYLRLLKAHGYVR